MPLTIPDRWRTADTVCRSVAASTSAYNTAIVPRLQFTKSAQSATPPAVPAVGQSCAGTNASRVGSRAQSLFVARRKTSIAALPVEGTSEGTPASDRLQKVLDGLDALNSQDPRSVEVDAQQVPYELAYARWLTAWVETLCADATASGSTPSSSSSSSSSPSSAVVVARSGAPSEELRIAARGQHVERWKVPRDSYPEGRSAYLQWREDLKRRHAATTIGLMAAAGYPAESCRRVEQLILKRVLREVEGQILEDALCLVFLERQFADFLPKLTAECGGDTAAAEAKAVDILQKSWRKMGPLGRAAALRLPLPPHLGALVGRALAA